MYNCDVYKIKLNKEISQHTESTKHSDWQHFEFDEYLQMTGLNELTPTHNKYGELFISKLKEQIVTSNTARDEPIKDALFIEAQVEGYPVNALVDTGSVGSIITQWYLRQINKKIDEPAKTKIIGVNGKTMMLLGIIKGVTVEVNGITVNEDMLVTDAIGYN